MNFRCYFVGENIKSSWNSWETPRFSLKIVNFRFCMGGIPPGFSVQGEYFDEIIPEMKRSQLVRIQNSKFCNIPTIMKKVMDDRNPKIFYP